MLRSLAAGMLLFLMVGDLAIHVVESYFDDPAIPADDFSHFSGGNQHPIHDESNCPIPGHSGGPFHHHHFPGIVTSLAAVVPSTILRVAFSRPVELAGSAVFVAHPGRAPPLS